MEQTNFKMPPSVQRQQTGGTKAKASAFIVEELAYNIDSSEGHEMSKNTSSRFRTPEKPRRPPVIKQGFLSPKVAVTSPVPLFIPSKQLSLSMSKDCQLLNSLLGPRPPLSTETRPRIQQSDKEADSAARSTRRPYTKSLEARKSDLSPFSQKETTDIEKDSRQRANFDEFICRARQGARNNEMIKMISEDRLLKKSMFGSIDKSMKPVRGDRLPSQRNKQQGAVNQQLKVQTAEQDEALNDPRSERHLLEKCQDYHRKLNRLIVKLGETEYIDGSDEFNVRLGWKFIKDMVEGYVSAKHKLDALQSALYSSH